MNDPVPMPEDNDRWLVAQHDALIESIASRLSLDAGMHDVTIRAHHADLVADLGNILDLEAGLRAVIRSASDIPVTLKGVERQLLPGLRVLSKAIGMSTPPVRLTIRTHPAFRLLDRARRLAADLANSRDQGLTRGLHHLRMFAESLEQINHKTCTPIMPQALSRAFDRAGLGDDRTVARVVILEAVRVLDAALADEPDAELQGIFVTARNSAVDLGRVLVRCLVGGAHLGLVDALKQAREVSVSVECDRRFGEAFTDVLTHHLRCARGRAETASREISRELETALTLAGSLPNDFAVALTRFLTDAIDVVDTLGVALTLVHDAVNDFSDIDLRDVDLADVPLEGVRWSPKTQWPRGWLAEIQHDSVLIGPGLFEIREGVRKAIMA